MPVINLKQLLHNKTLRHIFHPMPVFGFIGLAFLVTSTQALAVDNDGDGVDDSLDNCILVANADQRDTDGDQYGNICDADLNQDLTTDLSDFSIFRDAMGSTTSPDEDLDGSGTVDLSDFSIFRTLFGSAPGPSCVDNPGGCQQPAPGFAAQTDFKIMMNYELGMHCTGFEFAYCCVLPAYNSILAQVVKPSGVRGFPELLEGDPNVGRDGLGRETVVRDTAQGANGFNKYVLKYWHDAQPRNDGRGKIQTSTLISAAEGNSLFSWNAVFDSAMVVNGALQYGPYIGGMEDLQEI